MLSLLFRIFFLGILILLGAILVNALAKAVKLFTWYDFFNLISEKGLEVALQSTSWVNLLFLFVIYPLLLGTIVYFSYKLFF